MRVVRSPGKFRSPPGARFGETLPKSDESTLAPIISLNQKNDATYWQISLLKSELLDPLLNI